MARVIYYSTGEIFWVNDPPPVRPHIIVPHRFAPVPGDHLFSYAKSAHAVSDAGHSVIGVFGRQRKEVRESNGPGHIGGPDPEFLSLGNIEHPEQTVLVLIATDSDSRAKGGSDTYPRIPFTEEERASFRQFRERGGGVYVTWDHGQLGYQSMVELELDGPVVPEPEEPYRPNVYHSKDSTGAARVEMTGWIRRKCGTPQDPDKICNEEAKVWLSVGPPAGYLQKIVPADLLRKEITNPHPIFNGVGGSDGIWIPAHSHEGMLQVKASLLGFDETALPEGVRALAVHVPLVETTFISFAVMAYKNAIWDTDDSGQRRIKEGAIIWDTSFHHLNDINWVSNGKVPWDHFAIFSSEALWVRQFPEILFEERLDRGMRRLFANAIKWLANDLVGSPSQQIHSTIHEKKKGFMFASEAVENEFRERAERLRQPENNYPSEDELSTVSPG